MHYLYGSKLSELSGKYGPPRGCILLARLDGIAAGCVALRPLDDETCEMKRLYVRPEYRGFKLGRMLAEQIIESARDLGYRRMRLDTIASRMRDALALYRALGFREVAPYCDNPFPDAVYMELGLE